MKKFILSIICLFAITLNTNSQTQEEVFDISVNWNGSLSSISSPWGSSFSRGVVLRVKNVTQETIFISAINVYGINPYGVETYIGTLAEKNINVSSYETITLNFNITSSRMPDNLPIIKVEFNTLGTDISNITINDVSKSDVLYDLCGRVVTQPKRGMVYIKGGRKIMWK